MTETALAQVNVQAPAVVQETSLISLIERAARDPSVDVNKMERLFDMHATMQKREAEKAFNAAMASAQSELEPVGRQSKNSFAGYTYADLATITEAAQPIISKHGFGLSFGAQDSDKPDTIRMVCDVTHRDGFTKRYETSLPYDLAGSQGKTNKTRLQAFGSTTTYGRRYMLCLVFNIATQDNDGAAPRSARKSAAESKRDGTTETFNEIRKQISESINSEMLRHVADTYKDDIQAMPEKWAAMCRDEYADKMEELKARQG